MPAPPHSAFLITSVTSRFGSYSVSIVRDLALDLPTHVVLGRDLGAFLRDALLSSGMHLDRSFDACVFLSDPRSPLSISHNDGACPSFATNPRRSWSLSYLLTPTYLAH
ncbi:hypothetical protein DFH09DRAFT_1304350 [Mycena vulgaris]|nr:hypothetical protein DFH09DRAFT_1304350 [Mycena vulgaris]